MNEVQSKVYEQIGALAVRNIELTVQCEQLSKKIEELTAYIESTKQSPEETTSAAN